MKKIIILLFLLNSLELKAQSGPPLFRGTTLPSVCDVGSLFVLISTDGSNTVGIYFCQTSGTWKQASWTSQAIPSGAIIFIASGSCPSGFTEVTALNGKMWRGTISANANVGTSSGSDSVTPTFTGNSVTSSAVSAGTPAGTNQALTFTGNSVTSSAVSAGTPAGTNAATATTGNCAASNLAIGTGAATACKAAAPNLTVPAEVFTGSALGTHTHTTTATGSINTPTFTGNALGTHTHTTTATGSISAVDTRAAYINLIGCSKN